MIECIQIGVIFGFNTLEGWMDTKYLGIYIFLKKTLFLSMDPYPLEN